MTSAVTGLFIASGPAPAVAAMAASNELAPEAKPGASPPAQVSTSGRPETETAKPTHIGVQVSNALLGLTMTSASNSATAPDVAQPPQQSTTALSALAIGDTTASPSTDNGSDGSDTSDFQGSGGSQNGADNAATRNTASAAQTATTANGQAAAGTKTAAAAEAVATLRPLPVLPQWHIRPRTRLS
jgi:hypothetical protein